MNIYLDNAATTPLDPEVFEAMRPFMLKDYGNPSSTHSHGRIVRAAIESSRKKIAELLNCTPGEIIFTSGGTEADNAILVCAAETYSVKHIISSPIEHHAVFHTLENLATSKGINVHMVSLDERGHIELDSLESLLASYPGALVSLMHANNEIGNLLELQRVADICEAHQAFFHTDAVQAVGHYTHDMRALKLSGMAASAHKFHGPKGVGFMYIRKDKKIHPFIQGGGQERNMRGGTENVYGIIGLTKAIEIAYRDMDEHTTHISMLKAHMIEKLKEAIPGVQFNGDSANPNRSLYTVLNVSLPQSNDNSLLLFNLDLHGISASGGSACNSGAIQSSHVLASLYPESKRTAIRFSFSKYNTLEEIDFTVNTLAELCKVEA